MKQVRVLIIDDEEEFAATLAERLALRDFSVNLATSAEQAMAVVARSRPDVVILDISMPDVNGLDVLSMIKSRDATIEVILLTGHASVRTGIDGMERGAFDYTLKPVDLAMLQEKIEQAFAKQRDAGAPL